MIDAYVPERRTTRRIQGKYFASYRYYYPQENRLGTQEHEALTLDISETGVSLVTDKKIRIGSELLIKFMINKEIDIAHSRFRKFILFTGTVVYAVSQGDNCYRLGIYFGPSTQKNEIKFFDIVCSPAPVYPANRMHRFLQATLHLEH